MSAGTGRMPANRADNFFIFLEDAAGGNASGPDGEDVGTLPSKSPADSVEELRSSPVSSLMTFDKREFFQTPSATSLMRCGILMTCWTP
jgi:hypothetical protein